MSVANDNSTSDYFSLSIEFLTVWLAVVPILHSSTINLGSGAYKNNTTTDLCSC